MQLTYSIVSYGESSFFILAMAIEELVEEKVVRDNSMIYPYRFYLVLALVLSACICIAMWLFTQINPLLIYLIAHTFITFLFFGYDKYQSVKGKSRIPEVVLHLLALTGGTLGAFAGQYIFRHKTKKLKFRVIFTIIVVVQIGVILWWYMSKR